MLFDQEIFIGVDPGGGRSQTLWAATNIQGDLLSIREGSVDEAITFIRGIPQVVVVINSPSGITSQLMQNYDIRSNLSPQPKPGKFTNYRVCDYLLKSRNIRLIPTPARYELAPDWMQKGFDLFSQLRSIDAITVCETNAHASFCSLLGRIPFLKQSSEGRIQRQLVLIQAGLHLKDPMDYYEEITRRKFLQGILPAGKVYSGRELDSLVSALTAWRIKTAPQEVIAIGDPAEGQIHLPVTSLKESYH